MIKKILITFLFTLFFVSITSANEKQNNVFIVDSIGTGIVISDGYALAKKKAIANAINISIEKAFYKILITEILLENFAIINRIVSVYNDAFIKTYKILAESKFENNYKVLLRVEIFTDKIKEYLEYEKIKVKVQKNLSVLFFISEINGKKAMPEAWWVQDGIINLKTSEEKIFSVFNKNGFKVLNTKIFETKNKSEEKKQSTNTLDDETLFRQLLSKENNIEEKEDSTTNYILKTFPLQEDLNKKNSINIAKTLGADIVVVGSIIAFKANSFMGDKRFFKGVFQAKIFQVNSGNEIDYIKESLSDNFAEAEGRQKILDKTSIALAEKLVEKINISLKKEVNEPTMVEVLIEWDKSENSLTEFVKLRTIIEAINGVKKVETREIQSKQAVMLIDFETNAKEFANRLMDEKLKKTDDIVINIIDIKTNSLKIIMRPLNN